MCVVGQTGEAVWRGVAYPHGTSMNQIHLSWGCGVEVSANAEAVGRLPPRLQPRVRRAHAGPGRARRARASRVLAGGEITPAPRRSRARRARGAPLPPRDLVVKLFGAPGRSSTWPPGRDGRGLGRALMEGGDRACARRGARDHMDLGTSDDDVRRPRASTRASGFSNRERRGPTARSATSTSASCEGARDLTEPVGQLVPRQVSQANTPWTGRRAHSSALRYLGNFSGRTAMWMFAG